MSFKTRKLTQTLRDIAQTRRETINTTSNIHSDTIDLQQIIGKENQTSLGTKLIKTGTFIALVVPEPIVSDLTGAALIATGYVMNKLTKRTTCLDVYTNMNQTMKDMAQLKKELANITL